MGSALLVKAPLRATRCKIRTVDRQPDVEGSRPPVTFLLRSECARSIYAMDFGDSATWPPACRTPKRSA